MELFNILQKKDIKAIKSNIFNNFNKLSPLLSLSLKVNIRSKDINQWFVKTNSDGYCFYVATYQFFKLIEEKEDEEIFWHKQDVKTIEKHVERMRNMNVNDTEATERVERTYQSIIIEEQGKRINKINPFKNWGMDSMIDYYFGDKKQSIKLLSFSGQQHLDNRNHCSIQTFTDYLSTSRKFHQKGKDFRNIIEEACHQKYFMAFQALHFFIIKANDDEKSDNVIEKWASSLKLVSDDVSHLEAGAINEIVKLLDSTLTKLSTVNPVINIIEDEDVMDVSNEKNMENISEVVEKEGEVNYSFHKFIHSFHENLKLYYEGISLILPRIC